MHNKLMCECHFWNKYCRKKECFSFRKVFFFDTLKIKERKYKQTNKRYTVQTERKTRNMYNA